MSDSGANLLGGATIKKMLRDMDTNNDGEISKECEDYCKKCFVVVYHQFKEFKLNNLIMKDIIRLGLGLFTGIIVFKVLGQLINLILKNTKINY